MTCNEMAFFQETNFMLQRPNREDEHHRPHITSLNPLLSTCPHPDFHGVQSFIEKRTSSMSFLGVDLREETNGGEENDLSDDGSQLGWKKRRLSMEQVKTLEKSFESGNKLEPERKLQLASALGLQPRQIAIWFQNRRARWKTKQLEKDYDLLKRQFEVIKADNDALQAQNQKLHAEILALKGGELTESINLNGETEGSCSNRSENSSDVKLDISRTPTAIDSPSISYNPILTTRSCFPPSLITPTGGGSGGAQLFPNSSKAIINCPKVDQIVKDESPANMFCTVDDQSGFWPWLEQQQHFN